MLKLALVRVTTRIVLREKNWEAWRYRRQIHSQRAIADAIFLNCESFTKCSRPNFDNNSFNRVALILVEVLLHHN